MIPINKEFKQRNLSFKFRKPMNKLHNLRMSLSKIKRRIRRKCNKQLTRRKIRLIPLKSRFRKDRRRSKNIKKRRKENKEEAQGRIKARHLVSKMLKRCLKKSKIRYICRFKRILN